MNNDEIEELARRGSSDPDLFYLAVMQLLAEIAKRLGGSTVPVWVPPEGKPELIMNGPIMPGEPLPPIITGGNQIRMNLPLSRQNGPFWEDIGRLMKVLGYTYMVHRLEHEIRLTLTKDPPF
jgi:hypothetical protein